jgi:hypothetical protein
MDVILQVLSTGRSNKDNCVHRGVAVNVCNSNIQETEAAGSWVWSQSGLHSEKKKERNTSQGVPLQTY